MERIMKIKTVSPETIFDHADDIKALWESEEIQATFLRRNEFQIEECAKYFLSQVHTVMEKDYVPSLQDIVETRERTQQIIENKFEMTNNNAFAGSKKTQYLILVTFF